MGAAGSGAITIADLFSATTYTGTGSSLSIDNGIKLSNEGGLTIIKNRDQGDPNVWTDTVRGVTKRLSSGTYVNEVTDADTLTAFNSNGFTVGADVKVNTNTEDYISWTFRQHPRFFEVQTFQTTYNVDPSTLSVDLEANLGMAIFKRIDSGSQGTNWIVWHKNHTSHQYFNLNSGSGRLSSGTKGPIWDQSNKRFTFYGGMPVVADRLIVGNEETSDWVGYFFSHDPLGESGDGSDGFTSCGAYTGNGSTNGPTVTLGWQPQWILIKMINPNTNFSWHVFDSARGVATDGNDAILLMDTDGAETSAASLNILSNGFKIKSAGQALNNSGHDFLYMAIRAAD